MLIILFINTILLIELIISIYNYVTIEPVEEDADHAKKLSLTLIITITVIITFINFLHSIKFLGKKRTFLNLFLLSFLASVFLFVIYYYLENEKKSKSTYAQALKDLENTYENKNKIQRELSLVSASIFSIIIGFMVCFFLGFAYYSRTKRIIKNDPIIVRKGKNNDKIKFPKKFIL